MMQSVIIGAGSIGQGYDQRGSAEILSHAGAHSQHPNIELLGFIDTAVERGQEAAKKWNCQYLGPELAVAAKADLLVVSSTTSAHYPILKQILRDCAPRAVLVEKPFCRNAREAKEIVGLFADRSIPILVNYSRNYLLSWQKVSTRRERFGNLRFARFRHYETFENSGSHALALIVSILSQQPSLDNVSYLVSTSSVTLTSAILRADKAQIALSIERFLGKDYHPWDLELMFERGSLIILERDGILLMESDLKESELYPGYFEEHCTRQNRPGPSEAMVNATENLYRVAERTERPVFDGMAALSVRQLLDELSRATQLR